MFQIGDQVRIRFGYYAGWLGEVACVTGRRLEHIGVRVDGCFCGYTVDELEAVA
jgi:hypothetical protein